MIRIHNIHTCLVGKVCRLTKIGVLLSQEYEKLFGIGNQYKVQDIYNICESGFGCLMFIDEPPWQTFGFTFYCLKIVAKGSDDWYWFTLNQLMICDENPDGLLI